MKKQLFTLAITTAMLLWGSNEQAFAGLQLKLVDNNNPVNTVLVTDNGPGDSNPNLGEIAFSGAVGPNWFFNVCGGVSKPSLGSASLPQLDLTTKDFSVGAGSLTVLLSDTDYAGAAPVTIATAIGGTTVGSVTFNTYADAGNANFATTTPLTSQGPFTASPFNGNGSFTGNPGGSPYSLTLETIITHAAGGSSGFDANLSGSSSAPPCIKLIKTAIPTQALPGQLVTYYYAVTNCGTITVDNINVVDDNGTPGDPSDDYFVNPAPFSLAPGQGTLFAIPKISEPTCITVSGTNKFAGSLTVQVLASGDIKVDFRQARTLNDNVYGAPAPADGWAKGHSFGNLTGSDKAEFRFTDTTGKVVLDFYSDYVTATNPSAAFPAGYASLGPNGGDGSMITGAKSNVLSYTSTLAESLNHTPPYPSLYLVNSPTPEGSFPTWDYVDGYTVVVSAKAFGAAGFGGVSIPYVHNSPAKTGNNQVSPTNVCECVINTANAFAIQGGNVIAQSTDDAKVCFGPPPPCNVLGPCTPPYPFASANPLTSVAFNEPECLATNVIKVVGDCVPTQVEIFYSDEHALTLGIRRLITKTKVGSVVTLTTNNYPISPLTTNPGSVTNPAVGATVAQGGVDVSGRPMFPSMFVTDITGGGNPLAGDWQYGGTAQKPNFVSGTWKGAVGTLDKTVTPNVFTVTPDADPASNKLVLGPGSDPIPTPLATSDQAYTAEIRWDISSLVDNLGLPLQSGHTYRLYFMVHDGDQNKTGGDVGQACGTITIP